MKGIIKLKVPPTPITPKLFFIVCSRNGIQIKFIKVAFDLTSAIKGHWYNGRLLTINEYVTHTEVTVDKINELFKNFNPAIITS